MGSVSVIGNSYLKRSKCGKRNAGCFSIHSPTTPYKKYHSEVNQQDIQSIIRLFIRDLYSAFCLCPNKKPFKVEFFLVNTPTHSTTTPDYVPSHYYSSHPPWILAHRNTTANQADSDPLISKSAFQSTGHSYTHSNKQLFRKQQTGRNVLGLWGNR